jgi:hypothetical protein
MVYRRATRATILKSFKKVWGMAASPLPLKILKSKKIVALVALI